ncbi:hypothetical protein D5086_005755 [Populus alba]|uniref:Uncharacterized protein n=1 Tax=Populus alba TaxID=43335 RepID=A0ACC4CUI6_POPAL
MTSSKLSLSCLVSRLYHSRPAGMSSADQRLLVGGITSLSIITFAQSLQMAVAQRAIHLQCNACNSYFTMSAAVPLDYHRLNS